MYIVHKGQVVEGAGEQLEVVGEQLVLLLAPDEVDL